MNMPAFTAEASLYMGGGSYCGNIRASRVGAATAIVPQQDSGCTVLCADWIGCTNTCGAWPPGFGNAQCWLDCLRPSTDCLQGCFPPPPQQCCPFGTTCRCGGECVMVNGRLRCVGGECLRRNQVCQ